MYIYAPFSKMKLLFKVNKNYKGGSSRNGSAVMNPTRIHKDADSIPGLAHWVKDLVLSWAVVWVADEAQILSCGWGIGWQLRFPILETSICHGCVPKKQNKKKPKKQNYKGVHSQFGGTERYKGGNLKPFLNLTQTFSMLIFMYGCA